VPQIDRGAYALMPESSIQYDKSRGGKVMNTTSTASFKDLFFLFVGRFSTALLLKMILTTPSFLVFGFVL